MGDVKLLEIDGIHSDREGLDMKGRWDSSSRL